MTRTMLAAAAALALAGCGSSGPHAGTAAAPASASAPARPVLAAMPDFNGIGPLRFGMTSAQVRKAWGIPLYGEPQANDPQACYYLGLRKDDPGVLLMVEGDRFVRVDVRTPDKTAPGGGKVGMHLQQIEKLYSNQMQAEPGKYDPAARVLTVMAPHDAHARLVFETDASGVVTAWRTGVTPQVDYVEGCG